MSSELEKSKRIKELSDKIGICSHVQMVVAMRGWREIIEPLIDKSITDITGCKMPNGRWHGGLLDKARKDEKREYYIGYKQALIDLHRRVYGYVDSAKRLEDERKQLVEGPSKAYRQPMIDDTKYGNGEKI